MKKLIELTRVPFGTFYVSPDHIGLVIPKDHDAYQGTYNQHPYGCCVVVHGQEYRVVESDLEVLVMMEKALNSSDVLVQGPELTIPDPLPIEAEPVKKRKKK